MSRIVSRPTVTLVTNENGTHTFKTGFRDSLVEYFYRQTSSDEREVKAKMKAFTNYFEKQAKGIEDGSISPYPILPTLAQHGKFVTRQRLRAKTKGF